MIPSRTPVRFYWHVADRFLKAPGDWRFLGTHWHVERTLPSRQPLTLRAIMTAGLSFKTGKFTMSARVQVEGGATDVSARAALRDLGDVMAPLRTHGYRWRDEPFAHYPLLAWKSVTPRTFCAERRFLSELTETDFGASGRSWPHSLHEFLETFRPAHAGGWLPRKAQVELRKPIRVAGRPATATCMLHLAPADAKGRIGAASSITVWPPWNRKGELPRWLAKARPALDSQYRAVGHRAEWHRGPGERGVMITSFREDLDGVGDVVRERRILEGAHLGDPS